MKTLLSAIILLMITSAMSAQAAEPAQTEPIEPVAHEVFMEVVAWEKPVVEESIQGEPVPVGEGLETWVIKRDTTGYEKVLIWRQYILVNGEKVYTPFFAETPAPPDQNK